LASTGADAVSGVRPPRVRRRGPRRSGLPVTWALAQPKIDERQVLLCVPDADSELLADRPGLLLIADKGYVSAELDDYLHARGAALPRPSYRNRLPRPGQQLAPIRQRIESVYETLFSPGALQSGERL
jgi:hypothetical protein